MGSQKHRHAIFICYRREDAAANAALIYEALNRRGLFAGRVFMDVDELKPGIRFPDALAQALGSCDVLVAVIGTRWLELMKAAAGRPGNGARDYVLLEIKSALDRGVGVIPVLVEGARMPDASELPEELKALAAVQASELTASHRSYDLGRLVEAVKKEVAEAKRKRKAESSVRRLLKRLLRFALGRARRSFAVKRPFLTLLLTLLTLFVPNGLVLWLCTYRVALYYYVGGSPDYLVTRPEVLIQLAALQAVLVSAYSVFWSAVIYPVLRWLLDGPPPDAGESGG